MIKKILLWVLFALTKGLPPCLECAVRATEHSKLKSACCSVRLGRLGAQLHKLILPECTLVSQVV